MKLRVAHWVFRLENQQTVLGRCETCHWWDQQYATPGESRGHCHRLAPLTDHVGRTLWPRTNSRQTCGQYRPKTTEAADAKRGSR